MSNLKSNRRLRIKRRIRKNISGTSARPGWVFLEVINKFMLN